MSPNPLQSLGMAHTLAVDVVTAEVVGAFRRAGVRAVVLKGPTLAGWLYGGDAVRTYGDSDLLVPAAGRGAAEAELARLGFEEEMTEMAGDDVLLALVRPVATRAQRGGPPHLVLRHRGRSGPGVGGALTRHRGAHGRPGHGGGASPSRSAPCWWRSTRPTTAGGPPGR